MIAIMKLPSEGTTKNDDLSQACQDILFYNIEITNLVNRLEKKTPKQEEKAPASLLDRDEDDDIKVDNDDDDEIDC
jgi:hypothetical protein